MHSPCDVVARCVSRVDGRQDADDVPLGGCGFAVVAAVMTVGTSESAALVLLAHALGSRRDEFLRRFACAPPTLFWD